jgi:ABC-type Zn uptake system ZnuABC Zn-binding protein ZnuA
LEKGRRNPDRRSGYSKLVVTASALCFLLPACGEGQGDHPAGTKLRIVTTVAPITSVVANVVGDLASVTGVVPEGTNSHTFEPSPSVAEVLSTADVVFINGLELEEPTRELAERNLKAGAEIVELGNLTITADEYIYDFSFPREKGLPNPHLWTDPTMVRRYAEIVFNEVSERDPDNADSYDSNFRAFAAEIDDLDGAMRESFATLPEASKKLLTYHDAYAYFARTYGWTVIGAIQVSDFHEPTPKEVAGLIEQVRREKVPAIFGSEVFPSPVLEQIGREAGVRYVDVLRDDDLPGDPGDPEHSWLGLMRFDYATMVESLGGDASALKAFKGEDAVPDKADYPQ